MDPDEIESIYMSIKQFEITKNVLAVCSFFIGKGVPHIMPQPMDGYQLQAKAPCLPKPLLWNYTAHTGGGSSSQLGISITKSKPGPGSSSSAWGNWRLSVHWWRWHRRWRAANTTLICVTLHGFADLVRVWPQWVWQWPPPMVLRIL